MIGCVKSELVTMFSKVCCWIVRVVEGFFEFCKSGSSCSEELPGGSVEIQENGRMRHENRLDPFPFRPKTTGNIPKWKYPKITIF